MFLRAIVDTIDKVMICKFWIIRLYSQHVPYMFTNLHGLKCTSMDEKNVMSFNKSFSLEKAISNEG